MANGQHRCRRVCQQPLTDSQSDGMLPGLQQVAAIHTAAEAATEKSLHSRQVLSWTVVGLIHESVRPESSGAPLSTEKL